MKKVLYSISIALLSISLQAQAVKSPDVGIKTENPRATLDVNGNLRVQDVQKLNTNQAIDPKDEVLDDCPCNLVIDKDGIIKRVPISRLAKGFDVNNLPIGYVKDRNYGDGIHDFIYKVITAPDGKKWLNLNLGADYANVHSPDFNPDRQATSRDDYHAYGSLFQWQRKADGHELIGWKSSKGEHPTNTGVTNTLAPSWENAGTDKYIWVLKGYNFNWVSNGFNDVSGPIVQLWRANGANNPCPEGYHVPTKAEWTAYHRAIIGLDELANDSFFSMFKLDVLRLPAAGTRRDTSSFGMQGSEANYWSSETLDNEGAVGFEFNSRLSGIGDSYVRPNGFSVRCIQD